MVLSAQVSFLERVVMNSGIPGWLIILITPLLLVGWLLVIVGAREGRWVACMSSLSFIPLALGTGATAYGHLAMLGISIHMETVPPARLVAEYDLLATTTIWEGMIVTGAMIPLALVALITCSWRRPRSNAAESVREGESQ